ncbi:hypothetical protein OIV83_000212 [Microbotryomycetes sp. JL201]|nr:hypothetical protein OIV83_000212 [Microbotryomycetes sp. JL201]
MKWSLFVTAGALALSASELAAAGYAPQDHLPLDSRRIVRRAKCHRRSEAASTRKPHVKVALASKTADETPVENPKHTQTEEAPYEKPVKTTSASPKAEPTKSSSSGSDSNSGSGSNGSGGGGSSSSGKSLVGYTDSRCGPSGATAQSTNSAGPNGAESWLNCGMSQSSPDGEWNPPYLTVDQLAIKSLDEAVKMENSAFAPCAAYVDMFDRVGKEVGLPPIILASIAMQESTCRPDIRGGAGEYGMFQITEDKCGGAPNGDCLDLHYNMKTGASYLKQTLDDNGGDLLKSLGAYNGWYVGLSYNKATSVRGSCWSCQQNLDYLQQMLNGWFLGYEGYQLGTNRNLDH